LQLAFFSSSLFSLAPQSWCVSIRYVLLEQHLVTNKTTSIRGIVTFSLSVVCGAFTANDDGNRVHSNARRRGRSPLQFSVARFEYYCNFGFLNVECVFFFFFCGCVLSVARLCACVAIEH